jgi:hypothetical protein
LLDLQEKLERSKSIQINKKIEGPEPEKYIKEQTNSQHTKYSRSIGHPSRISLVFIQFVI